MVLLFCCCFEPAKLFCHELWAKEAVLMAFAQANRGRGLEISFKRGVFQTTLDFPTPVQSLVTMS